MENEFRAQQKKSYNVMKVTYDITMAFLLLGMAAAMIFADKLGLEQFAGKENELFRYFFGGICLLYGGFRLYRAFKQLSK
jgi:basic membrane lipoprotein Med (substrate-binding protein (PBP1-ABC) superfamily)